MLIFFIILWVVCGVVASTIASSKGHSGGAWFFIGVILGVFGVMGALILDDKEKHPNSTGNMKHDDSKEVRECPYCAETIKAKAILCRFCGRDVEPVVVDEEKSTKAVEESDESFTSREKLIIKAESKGFKVETSERSNRLVFIKDGKRHDFLILKRAENFIDSQ